MPDVELQKATDGIIAELGFDHDVGRLRRAIDDWITHASGEMQPLLRWQFDGPSKFYRPLTVFSCSRALNGHDIPDSVLASAVAVELVHNVSLVVDDILDWSRRRRGQTTLHCRFGSLPALMAAGFVVADAYRFVIHDPYAIELLSELLKRLGVAECQQWRLRRKPLGVEDWRMIAGEDTGSMFEVCACLGARSQQLRQFGHLLGLLYHGCDDVADVKGLAALGGGGQEDVRDGILTLPAALAIRDERVAGMFVSMDPGSTEAMLRAFEAELPEAETYLDEIADQARTEARLFAEDPDGLIALVDKVRALSNT